MFRLKWLRRMSVVNFKSKITSVDSYSDLIRFGGNFEKPGKNIGN